MKKITSLHYVARDGERVSPYFLNDNEPFAWLLRHQGQSTHWAVTHEGYSFETVTDEPWSPEEQRYHRGLKNNVWRHDHDAVTGDREERNLVRSNCGACVLDGYRDRHDDESPTDAPNYAGWARVYVECNRAVPEKFLSGFERDLNEDTPYGAALRRSVVTYGVWLAGGEA